MSAIPPKADVRKRVLHGYSWMSALCHKGTLVKFDSQTLENADRQPRHVCSAIRRWLIRLPAISYACHSLRALNRSGARETASPFRRSVNFITRSDQ
jgi:hypothetical protein